MILRGFDSAPKNDSDRNINKCPRFSKEHENNIDGLHSCKLFHG